MRAHVEPERVNERFLLKCELGLGQSWRDTESGPAGTAGLIRYLRYTRGSVVRVWGGGGGLQWGYDINIIYRYIYIHE